MMDLEKSRFQKLYNEIYNLDTVWDRVLIQTFDLREIAAY